MELEELRHLWKESDKNTMTEVSLNKSLLRDKIQSRTLNRITWIQFKAGFTIVGQVFVFVAFGARIKVRDETTFYLGALLMTVLAVIALYWSVTYLVQLVKVDFSTSITSMKIAVKKVENYKFMTTNMGYLLSPLALVALILIIGIPLFSKDLMLLIFFVIVVFFLSMYYTFKFSVLEQFRCIRRELEEIRALEKE